MTFESAPEAKDESEAKILAVLGEMDQNERRGMMNVPMEDGRLLRLLTEAMGAKTVVEIAPICIEHQVYKEHRFEWHSDAENQGHEGVGTIREVAPGSTFAVGDRVVERPQRDRVVVLCRVVDDRARKSGAQRQPALVGAAHSAHLLLGKPKQFDPGGGEHGCTDQHGVLLAGPCVAEKMCHDKPVETAMECRNSYWNLWKNNPGAT